PACFWSRQSLSARHHGGGHAGRSTGKVLGSDPCPERRRLEPARHRTGLVRGSGRPGQGRRAVLARRRLFPDAPSGTHGTRSARREHPVAVPALHRQDRAGSRDHALRACGRPGAGMKVSQLLTAPNQLTLLRMLFLPFIVISLVDRHYPMALVLFVLAGLSDGLDGLLARRLHQQTLLGQYLDPIADKLLLSTLFLVLSVLHQIPWKYTVMVFSRDMAILATSAVLYTIAGLRNFSPSIFGKANTCAQISAVFFVLLFEVERLRPIWIARTVMLWATFAFTAISWVHYAFVVQTRLRAQHEAAHGPQPTPKKQVA